MAGFQKLASAWRSISSSIGRAGALAVEPAGAVVRPRVGAVVGLARDVEPQLLEHRAVVLRLGAERGEEVAHHHAVQPGLDGQRLQVAQVLYPAAAEPEERGGEDQAEDGDPLDRLPWVHQSRSPNLVPGRGFSRLIGHARGVDLGQLEGHLHALLARLAEVEDAADAGLEPRLLDRVIVRSRPS